MADAGVMTSRQANSPANVGIWGILPHVNWPEEHKGRVHKPDAAACIAKNMQGANVLALAQQRLACSTRPSRACFRRHSWSECWHLTRHLGGAVDSFIGTEGLSCIPDKDNTLQSTLHICPGSYEQANQDVAFPRRAPSPDAGEGLQPSERPSACDAPAFAVALSLHHPFLFPAPAIPCMPSIRARVIAPCSPCL